MARDAGGEAVSLEYIRRYYGVPAEIGRRVRIDGKEGVIAEDRGAYIGSQGTSSYIVRGLGKVKNQPPDLTAGEFNRGE